MKIKIHHYIIKLLNSFNLIILKHFSSNLLKKMFGSNFPFTGKVIPIQMVEILYKNVIRIFKYLKNDLVIYVVVFLLVFDIINKYV